MHIYNCDKCLHYYGMQHDICCKNFSLFVIKCKTRHTVESLDYKYNTCTTSNTSSIINPFVPMQFILYSTIYTRKQMKGQHCIQFYNFWCHIQIQPTVHDTFLIKHHGNSVYDLTNCFWEGKVIGLS